MNLQYLAKVNRCSAQNLLESLQIPLPKGVKSLIIRRLKSHYDDADNLNMMGTIMLTKIMMRFSVFVENLSFLSSPSLKSKGLRARQ